MRPPARSGARLGRSPAISAAPHAMARMVQGDVGSGKTAVAMGAMLLCAEAGWQAALMAPTELLARQHLLKACGLSLRRRAIPAACWWAERPAARRREALESIASGAWRVVVGTHALISRDVVYHRLGLCVDRASSTDSAGPSAPLCSTRAEMARTLRICW